VIRVRVKYISELLISVTNTSEEEFTVSDCTTLRDLLEAITRIHGVKLREWIFNEKGELSGNVLIIVNGELTLKLNRKLQHGDTVILTIPFDGG
jgi:MoaD family protein